MFFKGPMESQKSKEFYVMPVSLEWKVDAIVEADPKRFAEELQRVLNDNVASGYVVSSMMPRDNGALIVIQQRRVLTEDPDPALGTPMPEGTKVN